MTNDLLNHLLQEFTYDPPSVFPSSGRLITAAAILGWPVDFPTPADIWIYNPDTGNRVRYELRSPSRIYNGDPNIVEYYPAFGDCVRFKRTLPFVQIYR